MKKGLTLIELMMTIGMLIVLTGVIVYILRAVLISWSSQETRAGIDITLDRAMEEMVRDIRETKDVRSITAQSQNPNEIRVTIEEDGSDNSYIYYLYNAGDSYVPPPAFDQASYELRRVALLGGIGGTFNYGDGRIIMTDVLPPVTSRLLFEDVDDDGTIDSSGMVTIDLSVIRGDETIRSRTEVKPRNL